MATLTTATLTMATLTMATLTMSTLTTATLTPKVLASFVVLNMIVAVILENFALSKKSLDYKLNPDGAEDFVTAWAELDPFAVGWIQAAPDRDPYVYI